MRWRGVAGVLVAVLVLGGFGPTGVYAQTAEEMRKSVDVMRKQLDAQQKRLEQIESEQALQQKKTEMTVNQTVNQAITRQVLEYQPAMALLGPAAMPPSAFGLGFFLGFDAQWINFRGIELPFAAADFGGSAVNPIGKWATVGTDRDFAPRFTVGFYLPGGGGIVSANYTWSDQEGNESFAHSNGSTCAVVAGVGPMDPMSEFGTACSAKAKNRVEYRQFDIQYQYPVQVTKSLRLTPEVGVRALWFKNIATANYFGCSEGCSTDDEFFFGVKQTSDSKGVGPKLGMGAAWEPTPGLSLGAAGSGGWLIGSTDYTHKFCRGEVFSNPGCGRAHNFSNDENIGFPFVGGDFSLTYTFPANTPVKGLGLYAGYRVVSYFDLATRVKVDTEDFSVGQHVFQRKNLMADSFYFGLSYLF